MGFLFFGQRLTCGFLRIPHSGGTLYAWLTIHPAGFVRIPSSSVWALPSALKKTGEVKASPVFLFQFRQWILNPFTLVTPWQIFQPAEALPA